MTWVLFDYGGVICHPQPEADLARLAGAAGCSMAEFSDAYWPYRLDHDLAVLDAAAFWQHVAGSLGRSFSASQIAELTRLDIASWLHLQADTLAVIGELAAAGHRLALLSNAPAEVAEVVSELPELARFEHLVFSCFLKSAKPDSDCFLGALAVLGAEPSEVIFIDDRADNVEGGTRAGLRCVHFTGPAALRAGLARYDAAVG